MEIQETPLNVYKTCMYRIYHISESRFPKLYKNKEASAKLAWPIRYERREPRLENTNISLQKPSDSYILIKADLSCG